MIYALYHLITKTPMDENGLPEEYDLIGGILDLAIIVLIINAVDWFLI